MAQLTDLNVSPYYDDFDEADNFHRVLFRPGFAIQARELTQLQSILQSQVCMKMKNQYQMSKGKQFCNEDRVYLRLILHNLSYDQVQLKKF